MPPVPSARNLKELPKFRDGLSYLYVEHAVVEREAGGIGIYDQEGLTLAPVHSVGGRSERRGGAEGREAVQAS